MARDPPLQRMAKFVGITPRRHEKTPENQKASRGTIILQDAWRFGYQPPQVEQLAAGALPQELQLGAGAEHPQEGTGT